MTEFSILVRPSFSYLLMEAVMALQEFTNPVKSRDDIDESVAHGEG